MKFDLTYNTRRDAIIKQIMSHAFWVGFHTALLAVCIIAICYGMLRGEWGPIKKAFEDGEKVSDGRQVLSDEQSEPGNG